VERGQITARQAGTQTTICDVRDLRVRGATANILAATAIGLLWNIPTTVIRQTITGYQGREHIIEPVGTWNGIEYYNDAKATNPWSVLHALDALHDRPVVLIAGGRDDKNADFAALAALAAPATSPT
jgi:UDP-N-acetylmuramoylalanine--D-glutamate ligase